MRHFRTTIVLALATLLSISICSAQQASTTAVPNLIRYSGSLKDAQGAALSSSTALGVTFSIYKQQDGGAAVWMETQNLTLDSNGQYSVVLGSTPATGLPNDLFSQQEQRWVGVQVQGQAEQPRVLLVSVPYALKAHEAETLGGLPASAFVKVPTTDATNGTFTNELTTTAVTATATLSAKERGPAPPITCTGTCTPGTIPLFMDATGDLTSSLLFQDPAATVIDDNGNFNLSKVSLAYQIGGFSVLSIQGGGTPFSQFPDSLFVGVGAGSGNVSGAGDNTFVGYNAGNRNTFGNSNTYTGSGAGGKASGGSQNSFYGYQAGNMNQASFNSFYGYQAGMGNVGGADNTFLGYAAGSTNAGGSDNTFIGFKAGFSNGQNASNNTFTGSSAGMSNVTGDENVFNGTQAGTDNVGGDSNTFIGYQAGKDNDDGNNNTFIGHGAGSNNTGGSDNTCIGSGTGCGGTNAVCIGSGVGCGTNQTVIGNTNINSTYIRGIYGATVLHGRAVVCVDNDGLLGTLFDGGPCDDVERQQLLTAQQDVIKARQQIQAQGQQIADLQQRLTRLESLIAKK